MSKKGLILVNLREYSASEIADAIRSGEITLYELSKSGSLTPLLKKRIEENLTSVSDHEITTESKVKPEYNPTISEPNLVSDIVDLPPIPSSPLQVERPTPTEPYSENAIQDSGNEPEIIDNGGMFNRIFSFKGRIRRTEYALSYIIFLFWYCLFDAFTKYDDINLVLVLFLILSAVPAYWFLWAQGAKRCHDRGNSGWYQIIPFYFLVMLFGGSEDGINAYGSNPKGQ